MDGRTARLAWGAVGGIVVFDLGWLVAGALQTGGYSVADHDVSDLAALTAQAPWVMLVAQGLAGALTIAFALFALGPALAVPGRRPALGAWLLATSLMGLDNVSDVFFRLDCRAADPGCVPAGSWHGTVHMVVGALCAVVTLALPFVLGARLRRVDGWRDLARPALAFGAVFDAVLLAYAALENKAGGGYLQRAAILLLSGAVVALALRARTLATAGRAGARQPGPGLVTRSG